MRRVLTPAGLAALCCAPAFAQPRIDYSKLEIKTTDFGHGVYLLGWQGGDSLILVGDEGVLLVDTSVAQMGDKIKAAIAKVSNKPIKWVVNTHAHADHFGANEAMAKDGALIVAHEGLRERMAKGQYLAAFNQTIPPSPPAALPKVTYADAMTLNIDGETVRAGARAQCAHRQRHARALQASERDSCERHIRRRRRVSILRHVVRRLARRDDCGRGEDALARRRQHEDQADEGEPASTEALKATHDMLVALRARVQKLIDEGKSEDEAVAAKPINGLGERWERAGGFLTADVFTRMAYQSLKGIRPPATR